MSNWGNKLNTKLNALGETSSKESIQTLAKWIGFNRKHAATAFVPVLRESLTQAKTANLQATRLSVIHEVLILDKDNSVKWDKLEELRLSIGEGVLLVVAPQLQEAAREKMRTTFLKEWDDSNSFGGPTIINQLRKVVSSSKPSETPSSPSSKATMPAPTSTAAELPKDTGDLEPVQQENENSKKLSSEPKKDDLRESKEDGKNAEATKGESEPIEIPKSKKRSAPVASSAKASSASTAPITTTYDFEASGIAAEKVDPKDLLEPTRTIASLQIARDLRNDGAVQLSSLLAGLPDNIKQSWKDQEELSADKARDYAMRTPDVLIDMDLEEQLQSIRMYRDIVKRQRASRKKLIISLIQSRCRFGAQEAAEGFENADRARGQLLKRKQVLMDAMELEGLDVTEEEKNLFSEDDTEFAPLPWFKKARTEDQSSENETANGTFMHEFWPLLLSWFSRMICFYNSIHACQMNEIMISWRFQR